MRTGVIVVFVLVAATPAHASKSCMTMAEARQQFATSHLYWHGIDHCWDATPPRHRVVRIKPRTDQPARQDNRQANAPEPKWRNAMSEMLPGDAPIEAASTLPSALAGEPLGIDWLDRWVDVAQVASPGFLGGKDDPAAVSATAVLPDGPTITPLRLMLMLSGFITMLLVIEILFRNFVHDWRR